MGVRVLLLWVCVGLASASSQAATIVDFEGIADGMLISTQYPGLIFSDALLHRRRHAWQRGRICGARLVMGADFAAGRRI